MKELLEHIKNDFPNQDRNSRIANLENSFLYLESKLKKIEQVLKDVPTNYLIPSTTTKKMEPPIMNTPTMCKRCAGIDKHTKGVLASMKERNERIVASYQLDSEVNRFLLKRIVGVYGNVALLDLLKHVDNPQQMTSERIEQYMKVKPHY